MPSAVIVPLVSKQEDGALALEAAAQEVGRFVESCPDAVWTQTVQREGRTVAELAFHCALGSDLALGWICQLLSLRPVHETGDEHDAFNAAEAERSRRATKADALETLRRTTARTAAFIRSLTDEELGHAAMFGPIDQERSVGQFIANFGRHIRAHLESMQTAVGSK